MKHTLKTSSAGRKLIKSFEGFRRKSAPLPGGGWVIGYGHTKAAREGVSISEDDADKLLIYDLMPVEEMLNAQVAAPLTQNQFDALASLALNIGRDNFLNSTVLKRLNDGRPMDAALGFDQWRTAMVDGRLVVVDALMRRRAAERSLFLTPPGGPDAAPSPEVPVIAEGEAAELAAPVAIYHADLTGAAAGVFEVLPYPGVEEESETAFEAEPAATPSPAVDAATREEEEIAFAPEAPDAVFEPAPEALEPEPEPQPAPAPVYLTEADRLEAELAKIELALDDDEPVEEVYVAFGDEAAEDAPAQETEAPGPVEEIVTGPTDEFAAEEETGTETVPLSPPAQGMTWADVARQRAKLAMRNAEPAAPEPKREYLLPRKNEDEWALDDDAEYSPEHDRSGVWYAVFLLIGAGLAGFGAWDTWARIDGRIEEAFVYGPPVAGAGVLFMAIAGWFLIKRVLAFR